MSYRDEADAARERRDALRRELGALDRAIAAGARGGERRRVLQRSLHDAERAVDAARAKVALPLLAQVRVASPCHARWEDMRGDERARHCASCDKTVFDLSAMRAEEAEALLRQHGASMCARFYRRADGTVMTADCSVGVARVRRRGWALAAGLTAITGVGVLGAGAALASLLFGEEIVEPDPGYVMGEMVYVPPVQGGVGFEPPPEPRATNDAPPHAMAPDVVSAPEGSE